MRVVICGGGVIGAAIAYYLSRRGAAPVVVERTPSPAVPPASPAGSWRSTGATAAPLEALARRSFALHAEIAGELGGDWGYRRLTTYGGFGRRRGRACRGGGDFAWLSDRVAIGQRLGSTDDHGADPSRRFHARP